VSGIQGVYLFIFPSGDPTLSEATGVRMEVSAAMSRMAFLE
jgi:hypothetical protein